MISLYRERVEEPDRIEIVLAAPGLNAVKWARRWIANSNQHPKNRETKKSMSHDVCGAVGKRERNGQHPKKAIKHKSENTAAGACLGWAWALRAVAGTGTREVRPIRDVTEVARVVRSAAGTA